MRVLAVSSQKGGSGKTTLAAHLAVQADRVGMGPVAMIDTDPQGSLSDWWSARSAVTPHFARTSLGTLVTDVARLRNLGMRLVVVDTPPAITATIHDVVRLADLVLVPTRPSPHDLRAAGATVQLVESLAKPLVFVINGATPRARITADAAISLSQHGTLAPSIVHSRVDFASSMIDGRTVMELPSAQRSSDEIALLWDYVAGRLERTRGDARAPGTRLVGTPLPVASPGVSPGTSAPGPRQSEAWGPVTRPIEQPGAHRA